MQLHPSRSEAPAPSGIDALVGRHMLQERLHGVVDLLALLGQVIADGGAQQRVGDVVAAVGEAGQVPALQLVLALCARLDPRQPPLNCSLQCLGHGNPP